MGIENQDEHPVVTCCDTLDELLAKLFQSNYNLSTGGQAMPVSWSYSKLLTDAPVMLFATFEWSRLADTGSQSTKNIRLLYENIPGT